MSETAGKWMVLTVRLKSDTPLATEGALPGKLEAVIAHNLFPVGATVRVDGVTLALEERDIVPAWQPRRRLRACVEAWPEAEEGAYDPRCCRFPKSCSAGVYDPAYVTDDDLEPDMTNRPA